MNGRKPGLGKQLAELHRWNGWTVLVVTVTGLLLAWEPVRGWLDGHFRNPVKQIHIILGLLTGIILALYFPLMKRHLKQLKQRPKQKGNLNLVIVLLIGWLLSGIVLWQIRKFSPEWANGALLVHDLLTWVGVPYILYHSLTRIKWMKKPQRRAVGMRDDSASRMPESSSNTAAQSGYPIFEPTPWMDRRRFLKGSLGIALAVAVAPSFYRWLTSSTGGSESGGSSGGMTEVSGEPNLMLPNPTPLPDSIQVIGGGARGAFRVYTVTPLPSFDAKTWSFSIQGLVDHSFKWNWQQFLELKRTVQVSDFHCVTGWSVYDNTWEGIPLASLLKLSGVQSAAKYVKFYSGDGVYTDTLTLEQANMEDVIVALLHDGKPIHRDYGGPVRLIVPKMYAYKSVKWLNGIELIDQEHVGYWEKRGYDTDAWVKA